MYEQFCDVGGGITLCYEEFGDPDATPMLLVMGLATQMLGWHENLCKEFAERGFHVIRFDNRDIGRSTRVRQRPPSNRELLRRRTPPGQYTLSDMADDTRGLMRELGVEPAHVVGASMGGMIGQMLAAEHPEAVRSLTSIMSTTGNRWKGQPALSVYKYLLRRPPATREEVIERATQVFGVVGTKYDGAEEYIRERAGQSFDRGHDTSAPAANSARSSRRETGPRNSARSTSRPSSSTGPRTSSSGPRAGGLPPRRSRARSWS